MASEKHWHFSQFEDKNIQIRGRTLFTLLVVLSILILVTLLFLYVRWICRYRNHPTSLLLPVTTETNQNHHGLDATAIDNLPIILYKSLSDTAKYCAVEELECCICLSLFGDSDKVKMLPECQHCFHSECVDTWLLTHSSCPLCRLYLAHAPPTTTVMVASNNA